MFPDPCSTQNLGHELFKWTITLATIYGKKSQNHPSCLMFILCHLICEPILEFLQTLTHMKAVFAGLQLFVDLLLGLISPNNY